MSRQVGKSIAIACDGAVAFTKSVFHSILAACASSSTVVASRAFIVVITAACSSAVTIARARAYLVVLSIVSATSTVVTAVGSVARRITRVVTSVFASLTGSTTIRSGRGDTNIS